MSKEPELKPCAECGEPSETRWTINNMQDVGVVDLCAWHSAPMEKMMKLGLVRRSEAIRPYRKSGYEEAPPPRRNYRREKLQPLDWKPPKSK